MSDVMYYFRQINPKHSVPQIMDKLKTKEYVDPFKGNK